MQYIERKKVISPHTLNLWKFIPEEWAVPALKRDYDTLFGKIKNKSLSLRLKFVI